MIRAVASLLVVLGGCDDALPPAISVPPPIAFAGTPTPIEVDTDKSPLALVVDLPGDFEAISDMSPAFMNKRMTASVLIDTPIRDLPYGAAIVAAAGDGMKWLHRDKQPGGYSLAWYGPRPRMVWESDSEKRPSVNQYYVRRGFAGTPIVCRGEASTRADLDLALAICSTLRTR